MFLVCSEIQNRDPELTEQAISLGDLAEISIITPSLNSADVIKDCIHSVAEQAVQSEHLIIDGNSNDNTVQIIKSSGTIVRIIQEHPEGIYAALNKGILEATGDIIGILHADDFYPSPGVLEQVVAIFENPSVAACYGDLCYVENSKPSEIVRYWRAGQFKPKKFLNC